VLRRLSDEERDRFLADPTVGVLATRRSDGRPLLSPVWFDWREGRFWFVIGRDDVKHRHLTADPRISVCIFGQVPPYLGVEAWGQAVVVETGRIAHDRMRSIATRYIGEPDADRFLAAIPVGDLVTVRLDPDGMRTFDESDVPGLEGPA
jgi:PPOX class probable F420-dependent enzyme